MHDDDDHDDHHRGLAHDMARMLRAPLERRGAIGLIGAGGAGALAMGLGGRIVPALAATRDAGAHPAAGAGACVNFPHETAGPFPANGARSYGAAAVDVLATSGIVRSDIRPSFAGRAGRAGGVPVTLTLTLVSAKRGCAPLAGHAVYLWQCDAAGRYSLYTIAAENYLRGVQATDRAGRVTFRTIFPAAYDGRFPHMHFEVYRSLAAAAQHRERLLTSQLAMPRGVAEAVYGAVPLYGASAANIGGLDTASDYVFRDNRGGELKAMTPVMSGSVATGYAATATVGIA